MDLRIAARVGVPGIVAMALVGGGVMVGESLPGRMVAIARLPAPIDCDHDGSVWMLELMAQSEHSWGACGHFEGPGEVVAWWHDDDWHVGVTELHRAAFQIRPGVLHMRREEFDPGQWEPPMFEVADLDGDGTDEIVMSWRPRDHASQHLRVLSFRNGRMTSSREHVYRNWTIDPVTEARSIFTHDKLVPLARPHRPDGPPIVRSCGAMTFELSPPDGNFQELTVKRASDGTVLAGPTAIPHAAFHDIAGPDYSWFRVRDVDGDGRCELVLVDSPCFLPYHVQVLGVDHGRIVATEQHPVEDSKLIRARAREAYTHDVLREPAQVFPRASDLELGVGPVQVPPIN